MATIDISVEAVRELLVYDEATGLFTRRHRRHKWKAGAVVGSPDNRGYHQVKVFGRRILAHRLAWFYVHGIWPAHHIDHINGDRLDNRIANLREATSLQNQMHRTKLDSRNTSGYRGVSPTKFGTWVARIVKNRVVTNLGNFKTPEAASAAYEAAAHRLYGEFYEKHQA